MNKNYHNNKSNQSQNIFKVKPTTENCPEKNKNPQKSKDFPKLFENKNINIQNKLKIKPHNRAQNNNKNKNKTRTHSRSKSKPRANNQRLNKISSGKSKDKSVNSNNINSNIKNIKNDDNNKINIFPNPIPFDKINSDINNINTFFKPCNNKIKIDFKKISKNTNIKEEILKNTTNYETIKYISLNDTTSLFSAWQNTAIIYKAFEEKLLKKNNFQIDKQTLELKTKNAESCKELNDQKFWILYVEYLINNHYLINEKQFLSVINEAFSYMGEDSAQLRIYYLQKIKKYSPCFLPDGSFDDSDDTYFNKLNKSTVNFIKKQKDAISSCVNLKSTNKKKNYPIYDEVRKIKIVLNNENEKSENIINKKDEETHIEEKKTNNDIGENQFEIIENPEK